MKYIQVFLVGDDGPEVVGNLENIKSDTNYLTVRFKEPGFPEVWEAHIPHSQVRIMRISDVEED